jgi:DNA-binding LacI/PurR family transcriptional regulator
MANETNWHKNMENSSRPTSADVARLAGVSRTQVSYVFSNTNHSHVSLEKRERILKAARELGYTPQQSAQALRKGYSNEFGIFFPAPYTPRINDILGTIHESGLARNCIPIQYSYNSYRDQGRKMEAFGSLLARRPIGLFCSLLDIGMTEIEFARSKGVDRILVLDVEVNESIPTLLIPAESAGRLAAKHLLELGHRRLGIIHPSDPIQERPFKLRLRGMLREMESYPQATLRILDWPQENLRPTMPYAARFVSHSLTGDDRPTGLYTFSDDYAYPLMSALMDRGVAIPADISLIGTDDLPYSELFKPSLSTIRFDDSSLGDRAVALINSLLTGESIDPRFLHFPEPVLVRRESTMGKGSGHSGHD